MVGDSWKNVTPTPPTQEWGEGRLQGISFCSVFCKTTARSSFAYIITNQISLLRMSGDFSYTNLWLWFCIKWMIHMTFTPLCFVFPVGIREKLYWTELNREGRLYSRIPQYGTEGLRLNATSLRQKEGWFLSTGKSEKIIGENVTEEVSQPE